MAATRSAFACALCLMLLSVSVGTSHGRTLAAAPSGGSGLTVLPNAAPTPTGSVPATRQAIRLAPTPSLALQPAEAPVQLPRNAPAEAPSSVQACYVDWQAKIQQQTSTSSSSINSPACVVVMQGETQATCTQQAQGRQFLYSGDGACVWPIPEECSGVTPSMPGITPCSTTISNTVINLAQQGVFNQAVMENSPIGSTTPGFTSPFSSGFPSLNNGGFGSGFPFTNPFGGSGFPGK